MQVIKSTGLFLLLITTNTESLRAQEAPCYEFLCGNDPSYLCGSDGVSYLNGCVYSQAQCKDPSLFVVNPGVCEVRDNNATQPEIVTEDVGIVSTSPPTEPASSECMDPFCPSTHSPVCGNNGITFSNMCQFTKAQCLTPGLELKHEGRCKSYENCLTRICPMREESLCGNDGKTYRNICELSIAKCYNPSLAPVANGPCV